MPRELFDEDDTRVMSAALDAMQDHIDFARTCLGKKAFPVMLISITDLVDMAEGVGVHLLKDPSVPRLAELMMQTGYSSCMDAHAHRPDWRKEFE